MDYTELVKRLREHGEFLIVSDRMKAPPNVNVRNVFAEDYAQAADAIEELSRENESLAKSVNEASEILRKRWIPVTERLPEQGKRYLVIRFDEVTKTQFIDILWHDAHDLWWNRLYKGQYNVTHWMPLPEPPKEET